MEGKRVKREPVFLFFFSVCTVNRVNSVKHEQIWEICQFVVFLPFKLLKHKR